MEIQRLRDENLRLKNQQAMDLENVDFQNLRYSVPPPPPMPPAPPTLKNVPYQGK
ncbi:MAG: hypothetical protein LH472_17120 [Pyrinomonadaceae bacterium]|nr:hypothetical protein [Pyrinomonadaceae bacterium]